MDAWEGFFLAFWDTMKEFGSMGYWDRRINGRGNSGCVLPEYLSK